MIEVKHVSGGYANNRSMIKNVSFKVDKGEFFVLLGPNGSGKSTLLKMLSGVLPVHKGEIWLEGKPLQAYSAIDRAQLMAVLEQEEQIAFDFNVEEIVALGRYPHQKGLFKRLSAEDRALIKEAMRITKVWPYRLTPFRQLSGGEKQRVLLAKALAQNPHILLMDEPTNHLDLQHAYQLLNLLKQWQRSKALTVFAILHDVNIASLYADRIALLQEGQVTDVGDVHLLKNEGRLQEVYQVKVSHHPHPQIPKPQFLLSPAHDRSPSRPSFANLYDIEQDHSAVLVHFQRPLKTFSNLNIGSGSEWASHFFLCRLLHTDAASSRQAKVSRWLAERHIPVGQSVGMTANYALSDPIILEKEAGEKAFLAIVTLESRILDMMTPDQPSAAERVIESVQTMLFIDGHLNDRAFVQAVISAVEAKSKVWHEHAQLVSNRKASTRKHTRKYSPDGLLIAATQRGNPVTGAEGTAVLGIEIDQIITEATDVAVRQFLGLEKETLV